MGAVILFHVDDALSTWRSTFDIKTFRAAFTCGSWAEAPSELKWIGRQLQVDDGGSVIIHQKSFTDAIDIKVVPPHLLREPRVLAGERLTEFKSCVGILQFLASNTRPDLAAGTSLIQGSDVNMANLHSAYQLLQYAKYTSSIGIRVKPIPPTKLMFISYGDSSWANAPGNRTHTRKLVVAITTDALCGRAPSSILDWRSSRTKRVVRSTLAAEAIACDTACDHAYYISAFFEEGLYQRSATGDTACHAWSRPIAALCSTSFRRSSPTARRNELLSTS